jgi:hypothetical protein
LAGKNLENADMQTRKAEMSARKFSLNVGIFRKNREEWNSRVSHAVRSVQVERRRIPGIRITARCGLDGN